MPANALVQARIDSTVKEEAALVLEAMGLTVSDAGRMLLTKKSVQQAEWKCRKKWGSYADGCSSTLM